MVFELLNHFLRISTYVHHQELGISLHILDFQLRDRMDGQSGILAELPVGYRFLPTDEELVTHYLMNKAFYKPLPAHVGQDINASELYSKPPNTLGNYFLFPPPLYHLHFLEFFLFDIYIISFYKVFFLVDYSVNAFDDGRLFSFIF